MKIKERELDQMIEMVKESIQNLDEIDDLVQNALNELEDVLALLEDKR